FIEKGKHRRPVTPMRARGSAWKRISVGRGEIIDDLANVGILDRRAIDLDHLRHFGLPEVLLEPARLSAIERDRDFLDALAAVESYSLQRRCARLQFPGIGHIGDEGADVAAVDRDGRLGRGAWLDASAWRVRNPMGRLHPETVEDVVD